MRAMHLSRRQAIGAAATWAGVTWLGGAWPLAEAPALPSNGPAGELLGLVPLSPTRGQDLPYGEKYGGTGLDTRLLTDLRKLEPGGPVMTPKDQVFIRTECPAAAAAHTGPWRIRTGGLAARPRTLDRDALAAAARPMDPQIMECSGNANPKNFGLLSVAAWDGVPFAPIVADLQPAREATAVLVRGMDHEVSESGRSVPTASWVYPLDWLDGMGAYLAVRMHGGELPRDHGAPIRLVIPGWYGCTWIKWVEEIRLVGPDEPSTPQMREFAARTEQKGTPELARDYLPAEIDLTGTPTRVEKRRVDGRLEYRIVGIVWGGTRTVERMRLGFGRDEWVDIAVTPAASHKVWSFWEYRWRPAAPGLYDLALKAADPGLRTRRLDRGYYTRQVQIDEV